MVSPTGELQSTQEEKIDRSILVVEDEVLVRMVLADQLREAGFRVVEARDADEALELLQHDALDVKAVISAKKSEFLTPTRLSFGWSGTLPRHSAFVRCAAAIWWGIP
jgi:hypothetical protein